VDLSKLEMAALWRYWRHFNLVNTLNYPRCYFVAEKSLLFTYFLRWICRWTPSQTHQKSS